MGLAKIEEIDLPYLSSLRKQKDSLSEKPAAYDARVMSLKFEANETLFKQRPVAPKTGFTT